MLTLKQLLEERVKRQMEDQKTAEIERSAVFWYPGFVPDSDFSIAFIHSVKKGIALSQGDTDYFLHANNCFNRSTTNATCISS